MFGHIKMYFNDNNESHTSKHEEVVITTTRIGHSRLIHGMHLITKEDYPICEKCDKEQTIEVLNTSH